MNLPGSRLDGEIETAIRRVCECLGLDLGALWQWSPDDPFLLRLTHIYRPLGGPPLPQPMEGREYFQWVQSQIMSGRLALEQAYQEIERLKERLEKENIYLRQGDDFHYGKSGIIGQSEAIRRLLPWAAGCRDHGTEARGDGRRGVQGPCLPAHAEHHPSDIGRL